MAKNVSVDKLCPICCKAARSGALLVHHFTIFLVGAFFSLLHALKFVG